MAKKIPNTFDWMTARTKCNVRELFKRLKEVVSADCNIANENNKAIEFTAVSEEVFAVFRKGRSGATFRLHRSEIQVYDMSSDEPKFTAKAYLLDGGDCTFVVDEKPLKAWQVSRMALEDVIF